MTVVDTVDFHCLDKRLPNGDLDRGMYSHKMKGPGLRYEIAHGIYSGAICWINGPFHAGRYNDLTIARRFGFVAALDAAGERCIADSIYKDDHFHVPTGIKTAQSGASNRLRARQEWINSRLKTWGCLDHVWRHEERLHGYVVRALLHIMQLEIDHRQLHLFNCGIQLPQGRNAALERKRERQAKRYAEAEAENDRNRQNRRQRRR